MKNLIEFLQDIHNEGWQLWSENGKLSYNAPKSQSTDSILATLKQNKTEILQLLPTLQNQQAKSLINRNKQSEAIIVSLTEAQKQLWFLDQLKGNSKQAYVDFAGFQLKGVLNIDAMERTIQTIVERHEALRTKICPDGKFQEVLPEVDFQIPLIDFSNLSASERESYVAKWLEQKIQEPFNLNQAPLLQVYIIKLEKELHQLILKIHHIIYDGFSMGIILQEISSLYEAYCQGYISQLKPPIQFREYIELQNQKTHIEAIKNHEFYWLEKFYNSVPILNLPTDRPRASIRSYKGAKQTLCLDAKLSAQIQRVSKQFRCTLFMTLLAAYKILLYKLTGDEDIVIGIPTAGRNFEGSDNLVGYCTHLLPIRSNIFATNTGKSLSFADFLIQDRGLLLDDYEHQDYPFSQLLNKLDIKRDPSRPLLVSTVFNLNPSQNINLSGLECSLLSIPKNFVAYDIELDITKTENELLLNLSYNSDLFDNTTIKRWLSHFQNLLTEIVENPQLPVGKLPLLSESERNQLLVEWNDNATDYPKDKCIYQLFEEQVEKTPDAVAVVFGDKQLTYQQLNQKANQLAHHLHTLGVKPEVLVGICVERSMEMLVGLLGILKAGGAYVPLDSKYPQERLSYMLADSGVEVLLTQNSLQSSLPNNQAQVICLDTDWHEIEQNSQENLDIGANSNNLAYVIYTSGSTGKPKGVSVEHASLCNLALSQINLFDVKPSSRVLQFASFSFDASVSEVFMAVTKGATIVFATASELMPGDDLKRTLQQFDITHVTLPPSALAVLPTSEFPQLSNIIVAGEACPVELAKKWSVGRRFLNAYGPSESTVCSTVSLLNKDIEKITIGRPISNIKIYILDSHLQPVPIGVPGELYIGGDGLARGYLNRPELTSEKFIQNPFENSPSQRLYKTGDLAQYLPDGNIEFLGRIDNQVKVRGFRIELGEIEAVLNSHPQVQQGVVITTSDVGSNKRLIGYVVCKESLTNQELRDFIKQKLPEYMVPSIFVFLDTLPLTPNGKVDRKALQATDTDIYEIERETEYIAPRNHTEETIANIFGEVVKVQNVGIHDDFFSLGGNSLLATQLISRLKVAFDLEIPLGLIFESPTVAQLEAKFTELRTKNSSLNLSSIQPRTENGQLPLSWAQERLWFLDQLEGSNAIHNISGGLRIKGNLDINALQLALSEIVNRHEVLRTSFQKEDGKPIQVIHPQATINIDLVDLEQLEATERENFVQQQAKLEANTPFNLEIAPLIRSSLLKLSSTEYVLLLTMHHIVSDGWSMGIFIEEVCSLYKAFTQGEPTPLVELLIQYADFAIWQRQYLSGDLLQTQLNYWLSQLNGAPSLLQLPTDRPRQGLQTYQGSEKSFTLNADLTQKVKTLSQSSGTTLFMTLFAAFATLLYRYSGQSDITIGSPIANRNRNDIEPLIGFFVNTLVLRSHFEDNPSFESLLAQVRETTLKGYENQDVPFEKLVEAIQPQRDLSYSPLFQVMFILQNAPIGEIELPGATLSNLEKESASSEFDLTLSITETDGALKCEWEYSTDLFDASTIERMAGHFENLLSAIVENPSQKVSNLNLLGETERRQLLVDWNDTATEYPKHKSIHQLFEEQVEKTPDAVAVVFKEEKLTYKQLNQKANQLARHLQSLGVKPEVLVGISIERSIEMVVGILGILKAGGAYVPFDPNYPTERLSYMLNDSAVSVLLTQKSLLESLPQNQAFKICLDTDWEEIEQHSQDNFEVGITSDNLAYTIYTSGSTGKPKGVLVAHNSLVNAYFAWEDAYQLKTQARNHLQMASFSFDVFAGNLVRALCSGGTLVLCPITHLLDAAKLYELMLTQEIDCAEFVPAVIRNLMEYLQETKQNLHFMKVMIVGSDSWYIEEHEKLRDLCSPTTHLINSYGVTEATIDSSYFDNICSKELRDKLVPIGHPFANNQMYILDKQLQPLPIGVPGELYIGGDGLARGYLNRPELTSEKFIQNPFDNSKSKRLYKTGDLARYLSDGNIEFLGRIDNQVKVRGFRIELGEIEALLNTHPQVNQAVIILREDTPGNQRLVAYIVSSSDSLNSAELRPYLLSKLPEYMVPSAFVLLEALPLTPNGKVDRKALPAPDINLTRSHEYIPPQTETEKQIAAVLQEVLQVEKVSIYDNFFELGANSLTLVVINSKLRQILSIELPVVDMFTCPNIKALSQHITKNDTTEAVEEQMLSRSQIKSSMKRRRQRRQNR
ncbi:MAG: amino acid adenylation domain-containing protein [Cyanobacteria bacterium J06633_8]